MDEEYLERTVIAEIVWKIYKDIIANGNYLIMKMAQYEYYAFISYKSEDSEWAEWLQKRIEFYKLPTSLFEEYPEIPRHLRPVFRDKSDLGAGILPKELSLALNASKFLIVICSKNAVKSPWVNHEIQHFIDAGRTEQIIPFIVDGSPYAGDDNECFPEAIRNLRGKENELFGININELGKDAASVKVVARLLGLKFDALWGRYLKEEKEKQRLLEQNNRLRMSKERASINKALSLVDSGQNLLAAKVALSIVESDKNEGWEPLPELEHLLRVSSMGRQEELFPLLSFDENSLFSPDGKYLLLWDRYKFDLIQLDQYAIKASHSICGWIWVPVFEEGSKFLAIADTQVIHIIGLGETTKGITIPMDPKLSIEAMKFITRNDEFFLCVVFSNGIIKEFNLLNSEQQHTSIVELKQLYITNAILYDRFAILYLTSQESDDVIINKVGIHDGTVEFIAQTKEVYYLHSDDCTKLVYSPDMSLFVVRDLTTSEEAYYQQRGHPSYVSNNGLLRFHNNDGTVDIIGRRGRYIANAPICKFWLSEEENACAYAIKDIEMNTIVYYNPNLSKCANYDGLIDISTNSIEIKRYKDTNLETLKVFGQHLVATGGDFGLDIYDANENRLVRHSDKGDDVIVSSDCLHLIVSRTMSSDPCHLYRYGALCYPISTIHDYDILTLDSSDKPIYYNLANKGHIEFFTEDGLTHTIRLQSAQSNCSLIGVHKERQLAAFRINDRPGFIKCQNGFCFDDSYVVIVNLKDFRCVDSVSNKIFQQDSSSVRFSHDGKWLLSINLTLKGLIAFAYEIDNKTFVSLPIPYRPLYYDRTDSDWAIADKTKITVFSTDGSVQYEKAIQKQFFSMFLIGEGKVLAYPFLIDMKRDIITHLENAEVFGPVKFDVDNRRDIIVACINDMNSRASVFVWQISSCKLLFSATNVITTVHLSPYIGNDCIYWKDMTLPYHNIEEIMEEMSGRFAGYKLSDDFQRTTI